jgi:hypothetical protein
MHYRCDRYYEVIDVISLPDANFMPYQNPIHPVNWHDAGRSITGCQVSDSVFMDRLLLSPGRQTPASGYMRFLIKRFFMSLIDRSALMASNFTNGRQVWHASDRQQSIHDCHIKHGGEA